MPFQSPDIIPERLRTYKLHLKTFRKEISDIKLLSKGGNPIKKSLKEVTNKLILDLDQKIRDIESTNNERIKTNISKACIISLEEYFVFGEKLLKDSYFIQTDHTNIGQELYYFVQYILDDFEKFPITIVIGKHPSLMTFNFWDILTLLLKPFFETSRYIIEQKEKNKIWVIDVPQSLLRNPLNWSLILHEIGHIFEFEYIKAVETEFENRRNEMEHLSSEVRIILQRHAEEYQADVFATLYLGPVYPKILNLNYYTNEINMPGSHPDWDERLNLLRSENINDLIISSIKKNYSCVGFIEGEYKNDSLVKANMILPLQNIMIKTVKFMEESKAILNFNHFRESLAEEAIQNIFPFTKDPRFVLNAACIESVYSAAKELFSKQLKETSEFNGTSEISLEINRLLAESIRLAYISRHYGKWEYRGSQQKLQISSIK